MFGAGGAFYAFSLLNALEMLLLAEFVIFFWISELLLLLLLFFSILFLHQGDCSQIIPSN